jgi:hypothetical protein
MSTGNGASLNSYVPFPSSNLWNTNIASAPVDPNSATIIGALTGSHLHPGFSNVVDGNYGIPYVVVDSSATPGVAITITAGTPVILSWTVSNDSYDYIDAVGPVRAGTQTVTPGATTIYTLNSTNQYGRATKSVTVNVQ